MTNPQDIDKAFEQWYVENAHDYASNPIGSRDCGLQRKAWHAAALRAVQEPADGVRMPQSEAEAERAGRERRRRRRRQRRLRMALRLGEEPLCIYQPPLRSVTGSQASEGEHLAIRARREIAAMT